MAPQSRILLLTRQPALEAEFKAACAGARLLVVESPASSALDPLLRRGIDLVAFDLDLPQESLQAGLAALEDYRDVPVLGLGKTDEHWQRMLRGSPLEEHLAPPYPPDQLRRELEELLARGRFLRGAELVGRSPAMRDLRERILLVAPTPVSSILLTGESGAGKDLVAEALHRHSPRREHPFRPLNCGAIPENLLENELFGHEKGAFTDARARTRGIFEQANSGTVFLDEIGEMSLAAQVRLLRVLEQREVTRIGGDATIRVDIRVVAATNRDLQEAVSERAQHPAAAPPQRGHPPADRALRRRVGPGRQDPARGFLHCGDGPAAGLRLARQCARAAQSRRAPGLPRAALAGRARGPAPASGKPARPQPAGAHQQNPRPVGARADLLRPARSQARSRRTEKLH